MRRRRAEKRIIDPDPVYGDRMVAKFINVIMRDGKKSIARRIVYEAFDIIRERTRKDPLEIFRKAIANVAPVVEVRSRRIGGANYQIPMEVREDRRIALAMRWIKQYARERRDKSMALKLAAELIAAANGEGNAVRKRDEVHRMAEANRAFAHYRW
ncbi:MAG: 30S ribosomal protein S7 [Candidatus Kapabacteria bacterium]|nr:30S ribosomal protein S7 [Candidatus Kapabacteria bacterium]MDW8011414.1 30S ribosomal protein S7 [Bacteroidota bacterium]